MASQRITHYSTVYELVKLPSVPVYSPHVDAYADNQRLDPNFKTGHYEFDRKAGIWWWRGTN